MAAATAATAAAAAAAAAAATAEEAQSLFSTLKNTEEGKSLVSEAKLKLREGKKTFN